MIQCACSKGFLGPINLVNIREVLNRGCVDGDLVKHGAALEWLRQTGG